MEKNRTAGESETPAVDLRRRAEEAVRGKAAGMPENMENLSPGEARQVLHELRVHQIELEMQNEELRRAQGELEASQARYFNLYDLAPVGYFTLSEQGLILEANLTAAASLSLARGALVKQPLSRFILPEDQDIYYRHRKLLIETGDPQVCEMRMLRADATPFWVRVEAAIAQDGEGAPLFRAVMSDITVRKRAEEEKVNLEAQNRQLQKAESLGRMAGAIAHHFNNQLQVVMINLELALDDLPRGEGPIRNLTAAMQATDKAAEVSGLMLTYLGQRPGKCEPLDLSEVCRRSLPMLRASMSKEVGLESDLPSPGPAISANENQIEQVLTNLVANAWEAVGVGHGAIHLRVKTVSSADILAAHRFPIDWRPLDNAYACLEVADTGCGIDGKDIETIFDPFFSSKFTGRGLGLPVVLGIVRVHQGAVTVESGPGRGSIFQVFLPLSVEEVPRRLEQAWNDGGTLISKAAPIVSGTVLLVEDEEMVREAAAAVLEYLGFMVLEAKDGIEAVEVFRQYQNEIHCVLCDLTMPRMNGWETLAALRKLAPDIPVILTSGYDKAHVMEGEHSEQPQAFLGKPYKLKELSDAICHALTPGSTRRSG
jgi:two-component system cell cycle sensor histidine kinase/response regulator CckA